LCESSDTLGKDRLLPKPEPGDLYVVLDTGAYGSVMASNYNRRLLPVEVLVENGTWRVIRRRQTLDDLLAFKSRNALPTWDATLATLLKLASGHDGTTHDGPPPDGEKRA